MSTYSILHSDVKNRHLRKLLADVSQAMGETAELFAISTPDQLTWRPDPKTWSSLECFAHLMDVGEQYLPRVRATVDYVHENDMTSDAPYKPGFLQKRFIAMCGPDPRFKLKAPKKFQPGSVPWDPTIEPRFLQQQDNLTTLIRRADGYDLNRVKFPSPLTGLLRFSIGEGLTLLTVHLQRHVGQAQAMREAPGFPPAES